MTLVTVAESASKNFTSGFATEPTALAAAPNTIAQKRTPEINLVFVVQ